MAPVIGIDVGGTFTDAFATEGSGRVTGKKIPSIPPDFSRAFGTALDELAVTLGTDSRSLLEAMHHSVRRPEIVDTPNRRTRST